MRLTTELRRQVTKKCPFIEGETDHGRLTVIIPGKAPELHDLARKVAEITAGPVSHEDFTADVAGLLPPGSEVVTEWETAGWSVTVRAVIPAILL